MLRILDLKALYTEKVYLVSLLDKKQQLWAKITTENPQSYQKVIVFVFLSSGLTLVLSFILRTEEVFHGFHI